MELNLKPNDFSYQCPHCHSPIIFEWVEPKGNNKYELTGHCDTCGHDWCVDVSVEGTQQYYKNIRPFFFG